MNLRFINSLQFNLAAGFLLVSLVPLGVVSLFSVRTADQLIEKIVTGQLENVAAEKQQLLERWIVERKADLEVIAASSIVGSMDPEAIAPYLQLIRDQYRVYRRIVIADLAGKSVYDSVSGTPADWQQEPWFRQVVDGQRYMSPVRLESEVRQSVFDLAAPVSNRDGQTLGVVCATVSTAGILGGVLQVSLGETGECYLVDETGTFLAHKDPARILRDNIAQSESFANVFRQERPLPIYRDYRSIRVLGASLAMPEINWFVVVEQDEKEAFAPAYELRRNIYWAIALTSAGAVGVSLVLAYSISAPIRSLSEAAHALAHGDFETHLLPRRRGEIGTLLAAFENMAAQLHQRHSKLETQVGRTEAELQATDDRLQETIRAAARSEHLAALGRLASGVAHEIRTPLASLKLYLQSVQEEITISPEFNEDFDIAMREVERIENTINHFLQFARPQQPVLGNVDLVQLVDEAMVVVRPRANHQDVAVQMHVAPDLCDISGDKRLLGEALVNILVNALDEMPGGGRLAIRIKNAGNPGTNMPGSWAAIEVTDSGPGIPEPDIEKLFEPFYTTKASGSGLGLAIVRGTVQQHGGILRIRSTPGHGTTFTILLPATVPEKATAHEQDLDC